MNTNSWILGLSIAGATLQAVTVDVVIPCHQRDAQWLDLVIEGARNCIQGVRRIITVSSVRYSDKAEWFSEDKYPFTRFDIACELMGSEEKARDYLATPGNRINWIIQQLYKLYALYVIPDIADNVFIIDADLIFLKSTAVVSAQGGPIFTEVDEYYPPYFDHMSQLLPGLGRLNPIGSGVAHHMIFQRDIMDRLFNEVEEYHGVPLWRAMCRCVDHKELFLSCFSEYELYYTYALARTPKARTRKAKAMHLEKPINIEKYRAKGFDYITYNNH